MILRRVRWRVAGWTVLAVALLPVAMLAVVAVTGGAVLRPTLKNYVREHAGRELDFDTLRIGLDRHGLPTFGFTGISVQNAPWAASSRPLLQAGSFAVTFTWASLWRSPMVVTRMTLADAEVDLERQADGLRNWRLSQPDDRGPGRVRVRSLDAKRSKLHVAQGGIGLVADLETKDLASGPGSALTRSIGFRGTRQKQSFEGQVRVGDLLTFFDTGQTFELEGEVAAAGASLKLKGRAADLMQLGALDLAVQGTATRPGELGALLGQASAMSWPTLPAEFSAHVVKSTEDWRVADLALKLGASDLSGAIEYRPGKSPGGPPFVKAKLQSERLDATALRPRDAGRVAEQPATGRTPREPFDAEIEWAIAQVQGLPVPIASVHAQASAHAGAWRFEPLSLVVAGGRVTGRATLETASAAEVATAELRLTGLQMGRIASLAAKNISGQLDAQANLRATGSGSAALLSTLSGDLGATLVHATLPASLEAELGLDAGRWLRTLVAGDARRAIVCSQLRLHVDKGLGEVRHLAVETENLLLNGSGEIDARNRTVDLTFTPFRKQSALLALDRSFRLQGPWAGAKFSLAATPPRARREACAAP